MKKLIFIILILLPIVVFSQLGKKKFPSYIYSEGFRQAVSEGRVKGYSTIDKFGVNLTITTTTDPEDIWEFGGLYNYDANGTAPIKYLSSSDVDDDEPIFIQGLDIDGYEVIQSVQLNGQNNVNLGTDLWRVYRMFNLGDTALEGIVYCHTDATPTAGVPADSTVRAIIDNGHNQTLMALYTIPKGKVGFLYRGEAGVQLQGGPAALAEYAHIHYESRRYGKVFTIKKAVTIMVSQGNYSDIRSFPDVIPALTDIKLTAVEVSSDMGLWATFDIMLVDEEIFSNEFLQSITQPGY